MSVYIDTSAFLAILNAADSRFSQGVAAWNRLLDGEDRLITSSYVVIEAISLLHNRFGTSAVERFEEDLLPAIEVVWCDAGDHSAAVSGLLATPGRHGPSLTDCMGLEVIRRLRISRVFAYDRHFENRGFELIG